MLRRSVSRFRPVLGRFVRRRRRALLLDPDWFFRDREAAETLRVAASVVLLVAMVSMATAVLLTWVGYGLFEAELAEAGYDYSSFTAGLYEQLPMLFSATIIAWFAVAVALHVLSWLATGEGSFLATLSVAAWGMAPLLVEFALRALLGYASLRGLEFGGDPDQLVDLALAGGDRSAGRWVPLVAVVLCWQAYVWTDGLVHERSVDRLRAAAISGMVAVAWFAALVVA